ncbi:MAG TPA: flagellar protein FlaG [Casimicrobiaceae bacterium]|nr:flagellar protein FlaG [Casimicrobiaceae bacterium]
MNILPTDRPQAPAPVPAAGVTVVPGPATGAPPSRDVIARAVARANEQMAAVAPSLEFEVDPDTHQVVIRLVDRQDNRVLRQVPSPEMLEIARALDRMQSLLLRGKA